MRLIVVPNFSISENIIQEDDSTILLVDDNTEVSTIFENELSQLEALEKVSLSKCQFNKNYKNNLHLNHFYKCIFDSTSLESLNNELREFARKFDCSSLVFYPTDGFTGFGDCLKKIGYKNCCLIPCVSNCEMFGVIKAEAKEYHTMVLSPLPHYVSFACFRFKSLVRDKSDSVYERESNASVRRIFAINIPCEALKYAGDVEVFDVNVEKAKQLSRKIKPGVILIRYSSLYKREEIFDLVMDLRNMYVTSRIKIIMFVDSSFYEEFGRFPAWGHLIIADKCLLKEPRFQLNLRNLASVEFGRIIFPLSTFNDVVAAISENLCMSLSEEYIRSRYNITVSTLQKYAKHYFGISLTDYQKLIRIENAVKLLRLKKKPQREIALICGFKTYNSFRSAFYNIKGELP